MERSEKPEPEEDGRGFRDDDDDEYDPVPVMDGYSIRVRVENVEIDVAGPQPGVLCDLFDVALAGVKSLRIQVQ